MPLARRSPDAPSRERQSYGGGDSSQEEPRDKRDWNMIGQGEAPLHLRQPIISLYLAGRVVLATAFIAKGVQYVMGDNLHNVRSRRSLTPAIAALESAVYSS